MNDNKENNERQAFLRRTNRLRSLNEDEMKAINTLKNRGILSPGINKFAKVSYTFQNNFTVALVVSGTNVYVGITKRNKTDNYSEITGTMSAFVRAIKYNNVTPFRALFPKTTSENDNTVNETISEKKSETPVVISNDGITIPKRGRGRPRKNPLSVTATQIYSADIHGSNNLEDDLDLSNENDYDIEEEMRKMELADSVENNQENDY